MHILLVAVIVIGLAAILFLRQPKFGRLPSGARLDQIRRSPNYRDGSFQNERVTPALTEGADFFSVLSEYFFGKDPRARPKDLIPSAKTDLLNLDRGTDLLVWFGHSSYFLQIDGKRILVDPVFSGAASPFSFSIKAFPGTDRYTADDLPDIDFLFISHDHWDHLDYSTIRRLRPRVGRVICSLGTGEHLAYWGYPPAMIIEKDWHEQADLGEGFVVHTVPARHFSGRGLARNKALWTAFVLQTPTLRIFFGGDSGYDNHFAAIGREFGPFDLAVLENGQYNKNWRYIHMMPEETVRAALDLQAKRLLPVHSSKFVLANHAWDEPLKRISIAARSASLPIVTPMIGEAVYLKNSGQIFREWWQGVQ